MGNPLLVANNLSDLGRLSLAHDTEANASRARDSELAAHMLQAVQNNRLQQQQLAQNQQRDTMQTALALASMQQQKQKDDRALADALTLNASQNKARMDELQAQIASAKDIATIGASRLDPALAGGIFGANIDAQKGNQANTSIESLANQELTTLNDEYAPKRQSVQDAWYYTDYLNPLTHHPVFGTSNYGLVDTAGERRKKAAAALELEYNKAINGIATKYAGKVSYDPASKRFKAVTTPAIPFPVRTAPGTPTPSLPPTNPLAPGIPLNVTNSLALPSVTTNTVGNVPPDSSVAPPGQYRRNGILYNWDGVNATIVPE